MSRLLSRRWGPTVADVPGRRWPDHVPMSTVRGVDGQTYVRNGFVCELRAGDFKFVDIECEPTADATKVDSMDFVCPRTGKMCGHIIVGYPAKPAISPSWLWDGNFDAPTLTPSINCVSGCGWHGWLRAGHWID